MTSTGFHGSPVRSLLRQLILGDARSGHEAYRSDLEVEEAVRNHLYGVHARTGQDQHR